MKSILILVLVGVLYQSSVAQLARNIIDVNNKSTSLDSLQGTKLLIIVLPSQTDTALNNQLLRFQKAYSQRIKIVALVSVQPGAPSKEFYASTYGDASRQGVIVSEGIPANEKAENERASVIQWMTGRSNNRQRDRYAVGFKFFLSEEGRVYAQLGKTTSLDDPIVKCIINTKVPTASLQPKTQNP